MFDPPNFTTGPSMCGVQAPSLGASGTTMLAPIQSIGKRQVCKTSSQWKDALRSKARTAEVKARVRQLHRLQTGSSLALTVGWRLTYVIKDREGV
jgi:hypothetical protein